MQGVQMPKHSTPFVVRVDSLRCTGCGWCVAACPLHLLSLHPQGWKKQAVIHDEAACTGCKKCELRCLFKAVQIARNKPNGIGSSALPVG
jgi:ferredoxin